MPSAAQVELGRSFLKTPLAAGFWISCRGLTVHAWRPAKRGLQ